MHCPLCERSELDVLVPRARIDEELRLRQDFFEHRMDGHVDPAQAKDRTDVAHDAAAQVLICRRCTILVREEDQSPDFEEDRYAPFTMERMLRAHIDAYRRKEPLYRSLLPEGSNILEIGSYVGGFLHVANEWGWKATGVDVGGDTTRFALAHGYMTRNVPLEQCGFEASSFDGVFIWNCFEQLAEPKKVLREVRRILRPGGVLLIRTPDAAFYMQCEKLRGSDDVEDHHPVIVALGHANLLGFPHLYGYTEASLDAMARSERFSPVMKQRDQHIMPSLRPLTATATAEAERAREMMAADPWLEAVYQ